MTAGQGTIKLYVAVHRISPNSLVIGKDVLSYQGNNGTFTLVRAYTEPIPVDERSAEGFLATLSFGESSASAQSLSRGGTTALELTGGSTGAYPGPGAEAVSRPGRAYTSWSHQGPRYGPQGTRLEPAFDEARCYGATVLRRSALAARFAETGDQGTRAMILEPNDSRCYKLVP